MTETIVQGKRLSARDKAALIALLAIGLVILVLTWFGISYQEALDFNGVVPLLIVTGMLTILAARVSLDAPQHWALVIILGLALLMRCAALLDDPLLSTDLYRYIWDGRVQGAGINPYRYVPADPLLAHLRDQWIYPEINRADYAKTIYPPVAQFFFYLVTRASQTTDFFRYVLIGCEAVTVIIILDLLRRLKRPLTWVVAYAWHPMAIWEIGNNGHIDGLMIPLLMIGAWFLVCARNVLGTAFIALAVLVKPYICVVFPAFWRPWDWRAPVLAAAVLFACYLPYLGVGWGVFGFLGGYAAEEGLESGDAFWLVDIAQRLVATRVWLVLYVAVAAAILGWLALRTVLNSDRSPECIIRDLFLLLLAGTFFLSPNYPWYALVLVPFLCLRTSAAAWVLTLGAFLLYVTWPDDWFLQKLIWKSVLYSAFLIALIADMHRRAWGRAEHEKKLSWAMAARQPAEKSG